MFSLCDVIRFDCNGKWRKNGHDFNPKGFFKSYSSILNSDSLKFHDEVILFGKKYKFGLALQTDSERLFDMSRQFMLELRDCEIEVLKQNEGNVSRQETIANLGMTALNLRSNISTFLCYIDFYLKACLHNGDTYNLSNDTILKLKSELDSMKIFVHELDQYFLSEQFLLQCSFPSDDLHFNAAYQLIHCCLDFRWFYILINYKLNVGMELLHHNILSQANYSEDDIYLSLMSELVLTSIVKYEFAEETSLFENILICPCIKEIWVLLFKHLGLEAFWDKFNLVIQTILEIKRPLNNEILENLRILSLCYFKCTDPLEFTIHYLREIAKLKEFIPCKTDYPLNTESFIPFYDNVKQYLKSNPSEKSLRVIIRVIGLIMSDWELEKEHVIVLLWEHFYAKLHSTFEISTNEYNPHCTEKSVKNVINDVKNRFLSTGVSDEHENSFELFLKIIAIHVQKSRCGDTPMKTLHSRIHIKFDNLKKFQNYSALALYHTSSLFLTLAIAFGVEKEVKKLRDLMNTRRFFSLSQEEKVVKSKTLIACLLLLAENGYNTKEITNDILTEIQLAVSECNKTLMPIFIEGVQVLIDNRHSYMPAPSIISAFTGDWIGKYVANCEIPERGIILSVFDPLIMDLREGAEWWSLEEMEDIKEHLLSYVLPAVKLNVYPSIARTAAQFLSFFIRSKNWARTYSLYNIWMQTKGSVAYVTSEFIVSYYEIEGNISSLGLFARDYEIDVIRCFISFRLLNGQTYTSHQLWKLVKSLPTITRYSANVDYKWPEECNIISFIGLFGACLKNCSLPTQKSSLKQFFNNCFAELSDCCEIGLAANASRSIIGSIYRCCACIVAECHPLIYEDNNAYHTILTTILDKVFLPAVKYTHYSELPPIFKKEYNECLPLLIRGLLQLNKKGYTYVRNAIKEIIDFNFPKSLELRESFFKTHSFYKCLQDVEIVREFSSLLQSLFLTKLYKMDNHQGKNCIYLFSLISCSFARDTIFSNSIYTLLNAVMEMDYTSDMLICVLNYINKCMKESADCRNSVKLALDGIAKNQSSHCSENLRKLLLLFKFDYAGEILGCSPKTKQELDDYENKGSIK